MVSLNKLQKPVYLIRNGGKSKRLGIHSLFFFQYAHCYSKDFWPKIIRSDIWSAQFGCTVARELIEPKIFQKQGNSKFFLHIRFPEKLIEILLEFEFALNRHQNCVIYDTKFIKSKQQNMMQFIL